jgi:hypothetical protein
MFKKSTKTLVLVVLVLILSGFSYAMAAANTVTVSKAGDGAGVVSGYAVSSVHYILDTTDPSKIASVTFILDAVATDIKVQLVSTSGAWYPCTYGATVTCTTTGALVTAANTLRVVAGN